MQIGNGNNTVCILCKNVFQEKNNIRRQVYNGFFLIHVGANVQFFILVAKYFKRKLSLRLELY